MGDVIVQQVYDHKNKFTASFSQYCSSYVTNSRGEGEGGVGGEWVV